MMLAILQVAHEARLIDGVDRAEAHRHGGELPEIRHQPGMRIGGKARMLAQFVPEILQMLLGEAAFQKRARIHAGRGVALEIDEVAGLIAVAGVKEVVVADFGQRGQRCDRWRCGRRCRDRVCWRAPPWPSHSSG